MKEKDKDRAKEWLRIHDYSFNYYKINKGMLHSIARANADEDGRENVCRNDYEAALAAIQDV